MENSPTEGAPQVPASNEPTGQQPAVQQSAESQNQDTNSGANTQGSVSDDTANQQQQQTGAEEQTQTQQTGGESTTDDGLAKFAASQGFDYENATDDVKRALKIAHDNQKAFRSKDSGKSITDATKELGGTDTDARVAQLEYERTTDRFWSAEGRDKSLEPEMVRILNEKAEQYGKDYAFNLSRDLDTLYGMAQLKAGAKPGANVDVEAIRREERESINRQMSASAPSAHATQGGQSAAPVVTEAWIQNEYDSRNPEHRKLVDEFFSKN